MIVVTRHKALVELLRERGLIEEGATVLEHVSDPEQIRGQHVIGVLPLSLAAYAGAVTEIPLALAPEDRGKELSIERLREIAGEPQKYQVWRLPTQCPACDTKFS